MNKFFNTIICFLEKQTLFKSVLILFFSSYIIPRIFLLPLLFIEQPPEVTMDKGLINDLMLVIIAPFIETILFLYVLVGGLLTNKHIHNNQWIAILISSLLFGSCHISGGIFLIISAIFAGMIFCIGYIALQKKYSASIAVVSIAGIHALNNFTILIYRWLVN